MAVPKKRTSKSKRNMRRSHHALSPVNYVEDKNTGEIRLQHHMSEGQYGGRQVIAIEEQA